jgi:flagellar basal body-associated protein FliL
MKEIGQKMETSNQELKNEIESRNREMKDTLSSILDIVQGLAEKNN